ncbi:hypothetical protein FEK30_08240 [Picosynechococcus sp. PCC 11901]|uniref:hypothetical protein n=1 Tax=Picosynechococcus sp. PCC 11901 TaxID=2579791 RepID=UPI0010FC04EC|nr:hypothetical protein [Picosynechococcus sp. PCC 11901]QCS49429.1 hypothetical protein FEK30_08240 [Picosynechococcus sp. PCC 11901]
MVHNFGYLDIQDLKRKIQIKVANFTEAICRECMQEDPKIVLGDSIWSSLLNNHNEYKKASFLELEERIKHYQQLLKIGESLLCPQISYRNNQEAESIECPVCKSQATIYSDVEWDVDVDHREGTIMGVDIFVFPVLLDCSCGFTLDNYDEIRMVLDDEYDDFCERVRNKTLDI